MTDSPPPAAPDANPRRLPRNIWALTATSLLTDVSSEMLLNISPLYLANVLGAPTVIIGAIEGAAETTASLLKLAAGRLSDRSGSRKSITFAGYALSTFSKPLLAFASTWQGFLAVRLTDRAGKGIRNPPRDALIADSIDPARRGLAFGVHRAGDTAGAALGLIIALLITLALQGTSDTLDKTTFQTLALVSFIPALAALIVLAYFVREKRVAQPASPQHREAIRWRALGRPFFLFLGIAGLFALGNSSDAFLVLRAQERGLSVAAVFGMLITFNLIYAALSGPLGALSDRIGRRRLLLIGWLAYGVLYLAFSAAQTGAQVWLVYALYGAYYAATEGTAKAYIADLSPAPLRGSAYGAYNMTIGLMALPASLLAGWLWSAVGSNAPFFIGAVCALSAAILLAFINPQPAGAKV